MNTFLPLADFKESAKVLDRRRLGKQRVEVLQILNVLLGRSSGKGWRNHPAVRMWRGYENALADYGVTVCRAWIDLGYADTCRTKILSVDAFTPDPEMPPWFGDEAFHASHRSNLLRKDPTHYGRFGWKEPNDLPYVWPTH